MIRHSFLWRILPVCLLWASLFDSWSQAQPSGLNLVSDLVSDEAPPGGFTLVSGDRVAGFSHSEGEWPGVVRAIRDLQSDLERVTGRRPKIATAAGPVPGAILIGTLGKSTLIDGLVAAGKLDVSDLSGRWEGFVIATVEQPSPGVDQALVIAGSDKRGTIYGIYELAEQIGVSPWSWWADVPVKKRASVHVRPGRFLCAGPEVRYRGIFLNDEAPALTGWARAKFGGLNRDFYAHVFELLLRLRANYLWPAMWDNAFNEDDPANAALADEFGIVMGTSHHEPMLRAHKEWKTHGSGPWDYVKNSETLASFWSAGVRRNRAYESIFTLGMRGDGDEPMSESANVALLQKIVEDQRRIIAREVDPEVSRVPQLWALYKEVQEYYERGMRVPDDVTLLWCDDNWGNIRRLPVASERLRAGGAGVYYHFDYVGGPRNYKWLNTVPLTKIHEQMHLAWRHEATRIWIVNVGDLKPMEYPTEFFLRYAWDPARWPAEKLGDYALAWAGREFGAAHASEAVALLEGYTKLNGLRKPEMLAPDTFSLVDERESERVIELWRDLRARARRLDADLPENARPAFYQLVLHPVEACAVVAELQRAAGLNRLYAEQGRSSANTEAERARGLFKEDAALTRRWDALLDGRWRGLMDQTHLGYIGWQQPPLNVMPAVVEVQPKTRSELAVAVEGDRAARPGDYPVSSVARLPVLHAWQPGRTRWFEVFNRGEGRLGFRITVSQPWLRVSTSSGVVGPDQRVEVDADWSRVPPGDSVARITVRATDGAGSVAIDVPVCRPVEIPDSGAFLEIAGRLSVEAPHFARALAGPGQEWKTLSGHGRAIGGVTFYPVTADSTLPARDTPCLEYLLWFTRTGASRLRLVVSPTQAFVPGRGLRVAVSLDDEVPRIIDLLADLSPTAWDRMVGDGVNQVTMPLRINTPGRHVLKIWKVDPGVVLQRFSIDFGAQSATYLGPIESPRAP